MNEGQIDNYKPPKGCSLKIRPSRILQHLGYYCLYSITEGIYFGRWSTSIKEVIKRADKENQRLQSYK